MDSPVLFGLSSVLNSLSFSVSPISISWFFHTSQLSCSSHLVMSLMFSLSCPGRSVFAVVFFFLPLLTCCPVLAFSTNLSCPACPFPVLLHSSPRNSVSEVYIVPWYSWDSAYKIPRNRPFLPKKFVFHLLKIPSMGYIYSKIRPHARYWG
jgi:hypothetical protein